MLPGIVPGPAVGLAVMKNVPQKATPPGLESCDEVYVEVQNGPCREREVEITVVSHQVQQEQPPMRLPWIDTNLLQRVEE